MRGSLWCGLIAVVLCSGCDSSPVGPEALVVDSQLSASVVQPGGSFDLTISFTNPSSRSIRLGADRCHLWKLSVRTMGESVDMSGTRLACVAGVFPPVDIAPGESFRFEYPLRALVAPRVTGEGDQPMDPGVYTLAAQCECGFPTQRFEFEVR